MRNNKFVSKMFTRNYFEKENTTVNSITNLYKALLFFYVAYYL